MIRRYLLREEAEIRVAISLGHIAKDLVVSAILFDDVNAMLDGAGVAELRRDGITYRRLYTHARIGSERRALEHFIGPGRHLLRQFFGRRQVHDAQRPAEEFADILFGGSVTHRLRAAGIRLRNIAFAVGD